MSKLCKNTTSKVLNKIIVSIITLTIIFIPFQAYSMEEFYINETGKEEKYWSSIPGTLIGDNEEYSGVVKYIVDDNNGCFYLCLNFYDSKIDSNCNKNISVGFTVTNSQNQYYFSIDKNGFTERSDIGVDNIVNICYSFDDSSCSRNGGDIYVAFEFKNKLEKTSLNHISGQYCCGEMVRRPIFDDVIMDMSKNSSESAVENSSDDKLNSSNSTNKNKGSESTTKFSNSLGTTSSENEKKNIKQNDVTSSYESEKFDTSENDIGNSQSKLKSENPSLEYNEENALNDDTISSGNTSLFKQERSKPVKIMIIISIAIIAVGVSCIFAGLFYRRKKALTNLNSTENNEDSKKSIVNETEQL